MSRLDQEFDAVNVKIAMSRLEYSLRKTLNNDEKVMQDFLGICNTIVQRHDILSKTGPPESIEQHDNFKRENDETYNKLSIQVIEEREGLWLEFLLKQEEQMFEEQ